ncbi:thiamine phosphate synthase [Priestia abyssalis]|uniref:thiamine phosphate synthase n=1 Tax=Priestia abyssalis TaxID=1221450 RepID=UPI0009958867|nr:thiamine phosphate synthase [Priestia abyssalis]
MMTLREQLALYFVMGSTNCPAPPQSILEEAIKGGTTIFQFREKGNGSLKGSEKKELAQTLQRICKQYSIPFIINDDVDLAVEIGADGVHIGQEDEQIEQVRQKIGNKILGVSVHNAEEAKQAELLGADYLGVGPIFYTTTKEDIREVSGPAVIQMIRSAEITLPLVGIGGIDSQNAHEVIAAGADGIALISAISLQDDPQQSARKLKTIVDENKKHII